MKSLWNDREAANYKGDLALRVYTSRLLGRDPALVLHGGGNTSVKIQQQNLVGESEDILYVKGSGWDLATIEEAGFAPVRMAHLLKLAKLPALTDSQMVNELKSQMVNASAPSPSVETILHATLPYQYVDHTHADAVVTITNTADGLARIQEVYGDQVVIIPYVMPGFDLARVCAEKFAAEAGPQTIGMVLMNHGIFSFGETAQQAYERMIDLVNRAEAYLQQQQSWQLPTPPSVEPPIPSTEPLRHDLAQLRADIARVAGFPIILSCDRSAETLAFARRSDIGQIAQQGPATPDHVIRTKRLPLIGRDVEGYRQAYTTYFAQHNPQAAPKTMLDPAPRVILDRQLGLCTVGRTAKDAGVVADIYHHTLEIIQRSTQLGGYQALPAGDIFDVEYWELEQAKLAKGGSPPPFAGEIMLVTGAASGIGRACVQSFLAQGAAVVGLDINPDIEQQHKHPAFLGLTCDVTDLAALTAALETAVQRFGGLDMLVLNAGIFPASARVDQLSPEAWQRTFSLNLDANLTLMQLCYPLLKLAPQGGRVVVIGSKNVPAPGPGAAAYSASKAALNQLARVAALEWGQDGIRINSIHPNSVFDTGIWTDEVLTSRAKHYGLSVEDYKRNNVMRVEITSHDVAAMAVAMCGPLFAKTTGAQVPLDGGNERVI
jgi:rhamnose utilization protein RhaD (predicted bifunctional aldolase and dehydrogenase)/NAD(P)-dependent dehydrogenase (short-subunit alcohol dehydrogenase family)